MIGVPPQMHGDDSAGDVQKELTDILSGCDCEEARRRAGGLTVENLMKPGLNMSSLGNNPDGLTPNDRSRYERAITVVMRWRGQ